jgi:3-demethylubiquinone-9 3-methyltransferase
MTVEFTLDRVELYLGSSRRARPLLRFSGRVAHPFRSIRGAEPRKRLGQFKFTEAISFNVNGENQEEIDYFWEKLSADGGSTGPCRWLKDKFGLSWQVTPVILGDMLADPDAAESQRVIAAILEMDKLDIAKLKKAYSS